MSLALNLRFSSFHTVVPVPELLLQPAVPDVQMFHSSHTSLVAKCPCDICICVQDGWQKIHPAELKIVLRQFGFFQQLAHAHDFTFSTAECVLSSRPAVAVQSTTINHQIPSRRRFPVNVVASPVSIKVCLAAVCLARPRHESRQVFRASHVSDRFHQLSP